MGLASARAHTHTYTHTHHTPQVPAELHFLRSKLQLVDLAGSERVKGTGTEGA